MEKKKKHFKSVNNFLTILMSNLKEKSTKIMLVVENQSIKPIPIQIKWKNDLSNNFEHDNALTTPIQYLRPNFDIQPCVTHEIWLDLINLIES